MNSLPADIAIFLKEVNHSNWERSTVDGFPAYVFKRMDFGNSVGMYVIASGFDIEGGYDGRTQEKAFYVEEEDFLRIARDLKENNIAVVDAVAFRVVHTGSWDHSYSSPEDRAYASIQKGRVEGMLEIRGSLITRFDLEFSSCSEKKELR